MKIAIVTDDTNVVKFGKIEWCIVCDIDGTSKKELKGFTLGDDEEVQEMQICTDCVKLLAREVK